ncbi:c-type cytochrome [Roseateles sp. BYS180W]|uniref:C-type cytochrome n=1 Tax=Roseateles rivi TaxID=3299028 RepID=A0ABW7FYE1_9BURK
MTKVQPRAMRWAALLLTLGAALHPVHSAAQAPNAAAKASAPSAAPSRTDATEAALLQRGALLFKQVQPACALCHTLAAAGSEGQIGPVLDELKPDVQRVRRVLQSGMGAMPSFAALPAEDIEALARYVASASQAPR